MSSRAAPTRIASRSSSVSLFMGAALVRGACHVKRCLCGLTRAIPGSGTRANKAALEQARTNGDPHDAPLCEDAIHVPCRLGVHRLRRARRGSAEPPTGAGHHRNGRARGIARGWWYFVQGNSLAAPPIEDLRWRAPQPLTPWSGVRRATGYGNDCVQMPLPGDAGASGSTRGEDCLVLNIWRPASLAPGERLPVLVWIHGGGFLNGAASIPFFDGSAFARDGVVWFGINYRLGRMGFFAHPALTAARDRPLANYGLMDQLAALRWVQRNVAAFGGDPGQVTIAGESAGGISVMHLLVWPEARGLFHRAAVLSAADEATSVGFAISVPQVARCLRPKRAVSRLPGASA